MGSYEGDMEFSRKLPHILGEMRLTAETVGILERESGLAAIMCAAHAIAVFRGWRTWESALAKCEKAIEQREKEAKWN